QPDEACFEDIADDDDGGTDKHRCQCEIGNGAAHHVVDGFCEAHEACQCAHMRFSPLGVVPSFCANSNSQPTAPPSVLRRGANRRCKCGLPAPEIILVTRAPSAYADGEGIRVLMRTAQFPNRKSKMVLGGLLRRGSRARRSRWTRSWAHGAQDGPSQKSCRVRAGRRSATSRGVVSRRTR